MQEDTCAILYRPTCPTSSYKFHPSQQKGKSKKRKAPEKENKLPHGDTSQGLPRGSQLPIWRSQDAAKGLGVLGGGGTGLICWRVQMIESVGGISDMEVIITIKDDKLIRK